MVPNSRSFFFISFYLAALMFSEAQQVKYWIAFKDKDGTPFTVSEPAAYLGQRSVSRRSNYNIPVHFSDLPVSPHYVDQVKSVPFVRVMYASKWLNGVVISLDSARYAPDVLNKISSFPFVDRSEKVKRNVQVSAPFTVTAAADPFAFQPSAVAAAYDYGRSFWQNRQLNVDCLHERGFRGQGMTIAVMDAGFSTVPQNPVFDSLRAQGRLAGTYDFVRGDANVYVGGDHGTYVLSCMAAIKPGLIIGTAPLASYWLFRTEEGASETISEEYNWVRAAEFADSAGADVLTTSLGYTTFDDPQQNHSYASLNGRTAPMSVAATMAARKGMFVLNSAGNEGQSSWKYISVAADADSVCAVGAVDSAGTVADFSSVGPTPDGRIKPDLVARGAGAWACLGDAVCYPVNGTSFSGPILAGAVACFWQANRSFNNMRVMDVLKRTASHGSSPNNSIGWGIPNMCAAVPEGEPDFDFFVWHDRDASMLRVNLLNNNYDFIRVGLYDLLGRTMVSSEFDRHDHTISLSTASLADNIYLLRIETPQGARVKKIVK